MLMHSDWEIKPQSGHLLPLLRVLITPAVSYWSYCTHSAGNIGRKTYLYGFNVCICSKNSWKNKFSISKMQEMPTFVDVFYTKKERKDWKGNWKSETSEWNVNGSMFAQKYIFREKRKTRLNLTTSTLKWH